MVALILPPTITANKPTSGKQPRQWLKRLRRYKKQINIIHTSHISNANLEGSPKSPPELTLDVASVSASSTSNFIIFQSLQLTIFLIVYISVLIQGK